MPQFPPMECLKGPFLAITLPHPWGMVWNASLSLEMGRRTASRTRAAQETTAMIPIRVTDTAYWQHPVARLCPGHRGHGPCPQESQSGGRGVRSKVARTVQGMSGWRDAPWLLGGHRDVPWTEQPMVIEHPPERCFLLEASVSALGACGGGFETWGGSFLEEERGHSW